MHLHGHKPTSTHYDGVDNGPNSYITRDVHGLTPAQRLDLELSGVDDGLHSFGEGVWMFHDHVEKAFTTDGVGEGGDISLVVYKSFLNEKGIPSLHGMSLAPYFTKEFWQKKYPIWQDMDAWHSLGFPDVKAGYQPAKKAVQIVQPSSVATPANAPGAAAQVPGAAQEESSAFGKLFFGLLLGLFSYWAVVKREWLFGMVRKLVKNNLAN